MTFFRRFTGCLLGFIVIFVISFVDSAEECLNKKRTQCFVCTSEDNPHCQDPFNQTIDTPVSERLVPLKHCEGCCVKIIREQGTSQQAIQRSCLSDIGIKLFMVDLVCMEESNGRGEMCFCEADGCNRTNSRTYPFRAFFMLIFIALPMISLHLAS
ncbi:glycosylphosphatidylinositol-anchored protein quiver [Brevipalpus obovatus]|uniref:glycosylphosphatidylinositol-anchored protein quiver n=1 Tax=Brevipalpus obovatus TaxID=246614 RepID=UPI003D9E8E66